MGCNIPLNTQKCPRLNPNTRKYEVAQRRQQDGIEPNPLGDIQKKQTEYNNVVNMKSLRGTEKNRSPGVKFADFNQHRVCAIWRKTHFQKTADI